MYKGKKIFAFIPARGGSKGIPNKNLYPLDGKPLIRWTIDAAKDCPFFDTIYCSTDSPKIASECLNQGCRVINRPPLISTDTSLTIEAVMHTLEVLKSRGEHYDYMLLLQPTSPLRTVEDINGIIRHTIDNDLPSSISVHTIPFNPILMRHMDENGQLHRCLATTSTVRRQDMKETYYVNGSLYMIACSELSLETSLNDIPNAYVVDGSHAIDINILSDIHEAHERLKNLPKIGH